MTAELEGSLEDVGLSGVGTAMGPMGAFEQPVGSLGLVSLEPLVASLAADIVASAEFGVGEEARGGLEDESLAFVHGIGLQPWHGQLQERVEGAPRYGTRLSPIRGEKSVTYQW